MPIKCSPSIQCPGFHTGKMVQSVDAAITCIIGMTTIRACSFNVNICLNTQQLYEMLSLCTGFTDVGLSHTQHMHITY